MDDAFQQHQESAEFDSGLFSHDMIFTVQCNSRKSCGDSRFSRAWSFPNIMFIEEIHNTLEKSGRKQGR